MNWRTIALDAVAPQPWRNGGGATRELLAWPDAGAWSVRISVAEIEQDGPFSVYPGVDRWFGVLAGNGVTLRFADGEHWHVSRDKALLQFDGERAPHCTLSAGSTRDLNVMMVREHGRGSCEPIRSGTECIARPGLTAVFAGDATRLSRAGEPDVVLPAMTLSWREADTDSAWRTLTDGRAWWIGFQPRAVQ